MAGILGIGRESYTPIERSFNPSINTLEDCDNMRSPYLPITLERTSHRLNRT